MKLFLIIKTELYQLSQDKRLFISLTIFLLIFFISIITSVIARAEVTQFEQYQNASPSNIEFNILLSVFCILSFSVTSLVVADMTAGEKERNTLEALFMTGCSRKTIFWGKYCVAQMFSIIPLLFGFPLLFILSLVFPNVFIDFKDISKILCLVIPYTFFISILLIYNGFKAKTIRAAKSVELVIFLGISIFCIALNQINGFFGVMTYYTCISVSFCFMAKKGIEYVKNCEL